MIVDGIRTELIEFPNLVEFLKPSTAHYILKYEMNEHEAIYYFTQDGAGGLTLVFCVDSNIMCDYIRVEGKKILPLKEAGGSSVTIATVETDTFLEKIINVLTKLDKPKKGSKKKSKSV